MKTLVTKLNSIVNNDNLEYFDKIRFEYECNPNTFETFRVNTNNDAVSTPVTLHLVQGTLLNPSDTSVIKHQGDTWIIETEKSEYYKLPKSSDSSIIIEITTLSPINIITCTRFTNFNVKNLYHLYNLYRLESGTYSGSGFKGNIQEYVENAANVNKSNNITIDCTTSYVYFKSWYTSHSQKYFIDFTTDSNVASVYIDNAEGQFLGSYNKTTKEWTYTQS